MSIPTEIPTVIGTVKTKINETPLPAIGSTFISNGVKTPELTIKANLL